LEQRLEAVLAAEPLRCVRGVPSTLGGDQQDRACGAVFRQHRGARTCLRRGRKRGQENQALGRSRGGFSSKIHLKTDFDGLPIAFHLTGGEVSDTTQLEISLDIGPDIAPRAAVTDKGYDSATNRAACRRRGIIPVIPYRENARNKPSFFPRLLYKTRARVEQTIGIQANCHALRQNPGQLWRFCRFRLHPHLGQIRPQGLTKAVKCH
jgi:transposase